MLFWTHTFGIWFYWYLVLLVFRLMGWEDFQKKIKFHGVANPPGGFFEKRQPAKPRMSLFADRLLSHSDTRFRIYVKNWLDWYQGHVLKRFLRRAVARQRLSLIHI